MARVISAKTDAPAWGASLAIEDRYRPMIRQLEALAARKPGAYRTRVYLGASLGYAYIALIILSILGIVGGVVAFMIIGRHFNVMALKLLIPLMIVVFLILKAMQVKMHPPQGLKITGKEAPELFAMLADVRKRLRGPKIDAVYITDDFNASIVQHPKSGILGGHRNIVSLGLPLLLALSREEVLAVVAHEYGHLAGAHGKMSAWVYRVRMTWLQLSEAFAEGAVGFVFKGFFGWYGPWFSAYSFVLARDNEYEADRASADIATSAVAARALTRVEVESQRYNAFWSGLFDTARHEHQVFPHARMASHFVKPMAAEDMDDVLGRALAAETDIHDTHPSLGDRLKALNEAPAVLMPVECSGAETLLGADLLLRLTEQLDADWWSRAGNYWTERCADAAERETQYQALAARQDALSEDESWLYQNLLEERGEVAKAFDVAQKRLAVQPDDPSALISVGRLMLERGDDAGVARMQAALAGKLDRRSKLYVLDECIIYLGKRDNDPRLVDFQAQFDEALRIYNAAQEELEQVGEDIRLEPAELDDEVIAAVRTRAARSPELKTLWIARRRSVADPDVTQLVVLYDVGGGQDNGVEAFGDDMIALLQSVDNVFAVRSLRETAWLKKRMEAVAGARIVKR